jgi:hypothetical protein
MTRLATALSVTLAMIALTATAASAETSIEVTTPTEGRYIAGQSTPLIVTISADQAVSGTLIATFDQFNAGSQRIDVPGGSTKEIVFVVAAPPWDLNGSVRFEGDDDSDDARARINLSLNQEDELVGVIGELAANNLPATAELTVDIGQARLFPVNPILLDAGPGGLSSFSQLLVTPDDLQVMDPSHLEAIESWVASRGGVLVVDGDPGVDIPIGTPPTTGASSSELGLGTISYSGGQALAGNYDGILAPTASAANGQTPWGVGFGGVPTTPALAYDAGVSIPPIGSLILVLLVYLVLAGPVMWFVLKRARREPLMWLALPALAVVATLGVYLFGRSLRAGTSSAHATVIADLPSSRQISTQVLVTSPNGGTEGVRLEDGWRPSIGTSEIEFFDGPFIEPDQLGSQILVGSDLVAELPPGGAGVLAAETTTKAGPDPAWQVELTGNDGDLEGTVTNLTDHVLERVIVASGQGVHQIPSIEPGESIEVTLRNAGLPPMGDDRFMEVLWNHDPWTSSEGVNNPGIMLDWIGRRPSLRSPGTVLVLGWTREESAPVVTTRGATIEAGRTAFVSASRVDDALTGEYYRLEFLRGWTSDQVIDATGQACADFPVTLRLVTSETVGSDAVLDLSRRSIAAMDVWDGSEWLPAGVQEALDDRVILGLPPGALDGNELYLRVMMGCDFWNMANPFPDLRQATAEDEVLTFGSPGDPEEATDA